MARLPESVQKVAQDTDPSVGFNPLPPGIYRVKCVKAKLTQPSQGDSNKMVANWELKVEQDGVRAARLWQTVSHVPEAAGMMHAAFLAFGLTLDSDEDEFIGEYALADVGVEVQAAGKNAGKERNVINALLPADGAVAASATAAPARAGTAEDPWK